MASPVTVCNLALAEQGSRVLLQSLSDTSPQGIVANLFYVPKTQALLRAANWDFARAQITLTVYKQATINGANSPNPPPQPFLFEYLYPPDCLKVRFILPTVQVGPSPPLTTVPNIMPIIGPAPTAIPFVIGTDRDPQGNPVKVILTNLPQAQCIYTRDLSSVPDQWDALFLTGETAYLAAYFINALARNAAQYGQQIAIAKNAIDQARMANGNEGISNIDHRPDWLRSRNQGIQWAWQQYNNGTAAWGAGGGWDQCQMPDGLFY